jgi:hypothetical protein
MCRPNPTLKSIFIAAFLMRAIGAERPHRTLTSAENVLYVAY